MPPLYGSLIAAEKPDRRERVSRSVWLMWVVPRGFIARPLFKGRVYFLEVVWKKNQKLLRN
jgi:hypothetical protein